MKITLTSEQLNKLDRETQVDPGFALRFLRQLQTMFFGAATESIDLSLRPLSRIVLDRQ